MIMHLQAVHVTNDDVKCFALETVDFRNFQLGWRKMEIV